MAVYFITKGEIALTLPLNGGKELCMCKIKDGEIFGQYEFFTKKERLQYRRGGNAKQLVAGAHSDRRGGMEEGECVASVRW